MLILVRHGRTAANAAGLLQGHADNPLDEVGLRQASQVAAAIGKVDRVISSPLLRARQTAEMFGLGYVIDERWIEMSYGDFDTQPMSALSPETWRQWKSDPHFALPGGETMFAMNERVRAACDEISTEFEGQSVVIVSHVSPLKAAVTWALNGPIEMSWRCQLDHAAVCRIGLRDGAPILRSFNEVLYDRSDVASNW